MALLDDARLALRVTSTLTDDEIQMWVDAALADMERVGVRTELLDEDQPSAMVRSAVICFVKGQYGYDNPEAPRFLDSYRLTVAGLLNSQANSSAGEDEPE